MHEYFVSMMRSVLILSGGQGRRLGYMEKALIPFGNNTLIEHIIKSFENLIGDIIISVRDEKQKKILEPYIGRRTIVTDRYKGTGPLAGMLEGFRAAKGEYVFVVACDMPFINADVINMLFESANEHDAALPIWDDGNVEPLHAVYRRQTFVVEIEEAIKRNERFVLAPVHHLNDIIYVDMDKIRNFDPELKTFLNINTFKDISNIMENDVD
ncbi:MAG: molybdenum cofactor guanylyltransferase [Methanohalobium sp.]